MFRLVLKLRLKLALKLRFKLMLKLVCGKEACCLTEVASH